MTSTIELVYVGARFMRGDLVYAYAPVREGRMMERGAMFQAPLDDHPVGTHSVYRGDNASEVRQGAVRTHGRWPDDKLVATWVAIHEASEASHEAWVRNPPQGFEEAVAPLREAYRALDDRERPVLIAQIVHAITQIRD